MRAGEAIKAVGVAALILALNMLTTVGVVAAYLSQHPVIAPVVVETPEVQRIIHWGAPTCGAALFFLAMWGLARRRAERRPFAFVLKAWIAYVVLDVGSGAAMNGPSSMLTPIMPISMGLCLAAALAGAALARPPRVSAAA